MYFYKNLFWPEVTVYFCIHKLRTVLGVFMVTDPFRLVFTRL
jgi:hypothetical protein